MAGKLKDIRFLENLPTVVQEDSESIAKLSVTDDLVIPFTKTTDIERRDSIPYGIILAREAMHAPEAEHAETADCATCVKRATCAGKTSNASTAQVADYVIKASYACNWFQHLNTQRKDSFINEVTSMLTERLCNFSIVTDEMYDLDSATLMYKRKPIKCIWKDETSPSFTPRFGMNTTGHIRGGNTEQLMFDD